MGWTGMSVNGPLTYAQEKARVVEHYTRSYAVEGGTLEAVPLQVSNVRPAWYVAVQVTAPASHDPSPYVAETLADGRIRYVFAEVMLTNNRAGEWMYKNICESAGPCESACPLSLIAKLSPLQNDPRYAADWRARAHAIAAQRKMIANLKPQDVIRLKCPANFNGTDIAEFTVLDAKALGYRKGTRAYHCKERGVVGLRMSTLRAGFELVK